MIRLLDLAADAAVSCTERLVVASARLHDSVTRVRGQLDQVATFIWWGSALEPRHCNTCLVSAPRGAECACLDSRPAPAPIPPGEPAPGREACSARAR